VSWPNSVKKSRWEIDEMSSRFEINPAVRDSSEPPFCLHTRADRIHRFLEIWVKGHSRSLKLVPFESLNNVSYSLFTIIRQSHMIVKRE